MNTPIPADGPHIITVASGKGGVGKTNVALNLAICLSQDGYRVCLLDADLGLANVDVLLGLSAEHSLMDFLEERCAIEEIMVPGPGGLQIIPGGSGLGRLPLLTPKEQGRLGMVLERLEGYDTLLIDAAAGISEQVLQLFQSAGTPLLVLVPEPTSLTDAYALLKSCEKRGCAGPAYVLVNQVKSEGHAQKVFGKFEEVVRRFLRLRLKPLGYVLTDANVPRAVSQQQPLVSLFPDTPASLCLRQIASDLAAAATGRPRSRLEALLPGSAASPEKEGEKDQRDSGDAAQSPPPSDSGEDIVAILLREKQITAAMVEYARKVQSKLDTPKRLLEILKDLGHLREEQIRETLYKNRTNVRLGSLLVELGYISESQLAMALNQQHQTAGRKRLGELLVQNNFIAEHDLSRALSVHLGFPYVEPTLDMVDQRLLKASSTQFFLSQLILPLCRENGAVKVAVSDPLNGASIEAAKRLFGPDLHIAITTRKFIVDVLEDHAAALDDQGRIVADKNETVALVDQLIEEALKREVSDIHIEPLRNRLRVRFRKDGSLIHYTDISKDHEAAIVSRIKVMASANITEKRRHQDGRILLEASRKGEETDIRVSFYVTLFGEKVVMRILTKKAELLKVKDLGMGSKMLDRFIEEAVDLPSGVVIITGPTGAGKTTTLYAAINYCNKVDTNIITAEEPVEYVIDGIAQCPIDPKIGLTFEETLRHILRQDPDVIILGEIRDRFSAESAIQAALTGHKVITTFHTEDSIGGLLRLMNMNIESFLISSTVVCVVAQRLVKKICPYCRKTYVPTARDLRRLKYKPQHVQGFHFQVGTGCPRCDFTGSKGRTGVFELLVLNEYVKEAILKRKTSYEIRRVSMETTGLVTLLEDGIAKAARGIISLPEIIRHLPLLETPRPLDQIYRLIGEIG